MIIIFNKIYASCSEAAKSMNVSPGTISYRLKTNKNYNYFKGDI
jgi:hypothetical protein